MDSWQWYAGKIKLSGRLFIFILVYLVQVIESNGAHGKI